MYLLPIIFIHYPANRKREDSNLLQTLLTNLQGNEQEGRIDNQILGVKGLKVKKVLDANETFFFNSKL